MLYNNRPKTVRCPTDLKNSCTTIISQLNNKMLGKPVDNVYF